MSWQSPPSEHDQLAALVEEMSYLETLCGLMADDLLGDLFWHRDNDGRPVAAVNCNDYFYWASGDAETILPADLPRLVELCREERAHNEPQWAAYRAQQTAAREAGGPSPSRVSDLIQADRLWVCEKRQMRPITPIFEAYTGTMKAIISQYPARTHGGDECPFCPPKDADAG